jgi:hypothetical protein
MKWLIPPDPHRGHEGFCVGDQVEDHSYTAIVIAVEDGYSDKYNHGLRPDTYVPVRESDGNINGWLVSRARVVRRALQMRIVGNELRLETS